MIIGICGKSGSGKSTLAKELTELTSKEVIHLDIDQVGHHALTIDEVKSELVNSFGESIIEEDHINRKKLGQIVFSSRKEMQKLSDITWKYMQIEIDQFLEKEKDKIVILDWILLPITKYFEQCDFTILLNIPYEVRKQRAMIRDGISEEAFDTREQASIEYTVESFDYVLNSNEKEEIKRLVNLL